MLSRRSFILSSLYFLGASSLNCLSSLADRPARAQAAASRHKAVVVVQLCGGNDGLNTVIPYTQAAYYRYRPRLAIKPDQVLPIDGKVGLHPEMAGLAGLYRRGRLAIVQGVGYPRPVTSHFRSSEIWHSAEPNKLGSTGWLGRYLDLIGPGKDVWRSGFWPGVNLEPPHAITLRGSRVVVPSLRSALDESIEKLPGTSPQSPSGCDLSDPLWAGKADGEGRIPYPAGTFGTGLRLIAELIAGGLPAKVYSLSLDGFDTHFDQASRHASLLHELSDGLAAFQTDLETHGAESDVVVVVYSEFGRRLTENQEGGTDHGAAGPLFLIGTGVRGGIYGEHPSLTQLVEGGLAPGIDFRTVYATILERWLGTDSRAILGARFGVLDFLENSLPGG